MGMAIMKKHMKKQLWKNNIYMIGRDYEPLKENNSDKEILKLKEIKVSYENRRFLLKNRHKCKVLLSCRVLLHRLSFWWSQWS